jgi:nascent polypeptide-associated complex subunit alpha
VLNIPKLPKSMQERNRANRQLRTQASAPAAAGGEGKMNRKMRRQMQQQGIEGMEEILAKRVIIQTDEKDIIIEGPQIIKLQQGGMDVYQIIGKGEEKESGSFSESESEEENDDNVIDVEGTPVTTSLNVAITEQDIQLVMMQTGVSHEVAEATLQESNGDLAKAIIALKSR